MFRRKRQSIIVIRHGERADLADYTWTESAARPYDPPLTERGLKHVDKVGKQFLEKVRSPKSLRLSLTAQNTGNDPKYIVGQLNCQTITMKT